MSLVVATGAALVYSLGVLGAHRYVVSSRRRHAGYYPTLGWLDWGTLLEGLLPRQGLPDVQPFDGGPAVLPALVGPAPAAPLPPAALQRLREVVSGQPVSQAALMDAGVLEAQARWLSLLSELRQQPRWVLGQLAAQPASRVAEVYLRLHLEHTVAATAWNLEWLSFDSKRQVARAASRFGEHPALYLARAQASALLGLSAAVCDDLTRAVYFSRQSPFYRALVRGLPFVSQLRPALARACAAD